MAVVRVPPENGPGVGSGLLCSFVMGRIDTCEFVESRLFAWVKESFKLDYTIETIE